MVVHKEGTSLIYVTAVHHISMSQYTHLPYLDPDQASENVHILINCTIYVSELQHCSLVEISHCVTF